MNTVDLLDRTIKYALSLTNEDEDTTERRRRILQIAQEVVEDIWYYRLWRFRKTSAAVQVGNTGFGALPTDFLELGKEGGVYDSSGTELTEVHWNILAGLRQQSTSNDTNVYAITDLDYTTGTPNLQIPTIGSLPTFTVYYERKAPLLFEMDRPTAVEGAAGLPNGAYSYKVTYITSNGESEGSRPSDTITVSSKHIIVTLGLGPTPATSSRKIYRTAAGGTIYKLLTTIADNITTTFDDNVADGSLGVSSTLVAGHNEFSLERIPSAYHFRVVIPGVRWRVLDEIPDARAKTAFDLYDSGKAWMAAVERPRKSTLQKLPRSIPRGMW